MAYLESADFVFAAALRDFAVPFAICDLVDGFGFADLGSCFCGGVAIMLRTMASRRRAVSAGE